MNLLIKEGQTRYAAQIPPGFKDADKPEPNRYHDLIIWKELLAEARPREGMPARPAVFVTNDRKEDWWRRERGIIVGPRTVLIREYLDVVGSDLLMITPEQLLSQAEKHLQLPVPVGVIAEVERISRVSPAQAFLLSQRMILPEPAARIAALARLHEVLNSGAVDVVDDLNEAIISLGVQFANNYVSVPLFWSLVNETYGPIRVAPDARKRFRARKIREVLNIESRDRFIEGAHLAWLAQALYRIRFESFQEDEVQVALFGNDPPEDAISLTTRALELAASDAALRGLNASS